MHDDDDDEERFRCVAHSRRRSIAEAIGPAESKEWQQPSKSDDQRTRFFSFSFWAERQIRFNETELETVTEEKKKKMLVG